MPDSRDDSVHGLTAEQWQCTVRTSSYCYGAVNVYGNLDLIPCSGHLYFYADSDSNTYVGGWLASNRLA